MRLYIAEKPSLARAIAEVLPKPHKKEDGCIRLANGDVVSWCIGHLLEQAEPEVYDLSYKRWQLDHLPIVPEHWQLQPKPKTRKQLTVLRKLSKAASEIIHAGDPDREGQLLVDEVIDYLKVSKQKRQSAKRLLVNDLNPQAVRKALNNLRPNREFIPLSVSALARSRADWLYGINLTRAWTIKGQQAGNRGVLSVGRVQTPVLGMIVRRDEEISRFVSQPFYEVRAAIHMDSHSPLCFYAKWQPSEACLPHQDEDGRVLNPMLTQNVASRIHHQPAVVNGFERKNGQQKPPLPYNLSALQIDAAKALGLSAKQVLDACQTLYEKYQLITYPRSDCRHLPENHHREAREVISGISSVVSDASEWSKHADMTRCSAAFNDAKTAAHHAIIPTAKKYTGNLPATEYKVYRLIARQYVMQFCAPCRYSDSRAELMIAGGVFVAKDRCVTEPGWKALLPARKRSETDTKADSLAGLPELVEGQTLWSGDPVVDEKKTEPPKHFTDATLLAAMTGVSRYVSDPELRKVLKDTDGLGTEATRAGIIELLFRRKFIRRQGKVIQATETGRQLIAMLPEQCAKPDMTALWEKQLDDISMGASNYQAFMSSLSIQLEQLITQAKSASPPRLVHERELVKRRRSNSKPRRGRVSTRKNKSKKDGLSEFSA